MNTIFDEMTERPDIFWDKLFVSGGKVGWTALADHGLTDTEYKREARKLLDSRVGDQVLRVMAILDGWGIAEAHQIALMTGSTAFLNYRSAVPAGLARLGLIQIGYPTTTMLITHTAAVRFYRTGAWENLALLKSVMTAGERLIVFGGLKGWGAPSGHDRHDLLALEVSLKIAEHHPRWDLILGERYAQAGKLKAPGSERKYLHRADGLLIRDDELNVALELTAAKTEMLKEKIDRWAKWLLDEKLYDTGTMVIFVCAGDPFKRRGATLTAIKKLIGEVLRGYPELRARQRPRERIGVLELRNWLPGSGQFSPAFESLEVEMLIGRTAEDKWRTVSLADLSFDDDVGLAGKGFMANGGTPVWSGSR